MTNIREAIYSLSKSETKLVSGFFDLLNELDQKYNSTSTETDLEIAFPSCNAGRFKRMVSPLERISYGLPEGRAV